MPTSWRSGVGRGCSGFFTGVDGGFGADSVLYHDSRAHVVRKACRRCLSAIVLLLGRMSCSNTLILLLVRCLFPKIHSVIVGSFLFTCTQSNIYRSYCQKKLGRSRLQSFVSWTNQCLLSLYVTHKLGPKKEVKKKKSKTNVQNENRTRERATLFVPKIR